MADPAYTIAPEREASGEEAETVAYQGEAGAFGHEACRRFLPGWDCLPMPTFASVAEAVISGAATRGVLPTVNSLAGPVPGNAEIIAASGLTIIAEPVLPVRMHLMVRPGVTIDQIRVLTSHPMALKQCLKITEELGLEAVPAANTAMAANELAKNGPDHVAVVGSQAAADLYGLTVLRHDVHDRPDNTTTFAVLARPRDSLPQ